jgi:diaminohydroxyphosphoribosylaminopyrimidine deaminase/5-amino-6-(5-phosphoribosylamino)uracil reductase
MTSPNPLVGAVLVKGGRVIARAYHSKAGSPHAEALVLREAGERARGAVLYVNLEPCCHKEKRTPPCTEEILRAGVRRVVTAMEDPNPKVSGRGLARLRGAGIAVDSNVLESDARRLNEIYSAFITTRRPFVILKTAVSLDGKIATASGESQWITGEKARRESHRLRASVDAVMVGSGTVLRDDPLLTVRGFRGPVHQPLRIVIDGTLKAPVDSKVYQTTHAATLVATTRQAPDEKIRALEKQGVAVLMQEWRSGRVDLRRLMQTLGERGVTGILVEGGGELNAALLREGIVDKVIFFLAPKIIGGRDAIPAVGGVSPERLKDALRLRDLRVRKVGEDLMVEGYVTVQGEE